MRTWAVSAFQTLISHFTGPTPARPESASRLRARCTMLLSSSALWVALPSVLFWAERWARTRVDGIWPEMAQLAYLRRPLLAPR